MQFLYSDKLDKKKSINVCFFFSFSFKNKVDRKKKIGSKLTVAGSSSGLSSSAWRRNTFPRDIRHNILSKAGTRSRFITPATNLQK